MLKDKGKDEEIDLKQLETRPTCFLVSLSFSVHLLQFPSKANVIGEEFQQREVLTAVHRTLDTGRCSREIDGGEVCCDAGHGTE